MGLKRYSMFVGPNEIKATNVALKLYCADTEEDYGTDFDGNVYVVKLTNNA